MNPSLAISTILFDFGGVLLRTEDQTPRRRWEKRLGLNSGALEAYIFRSLRGQQAQLGSTPWETVWQSAATHFHISATDVQQMQQDFFAGDVLDHSLVAYIRRLKPYFTIGLLSNTWHRDGRALLLQYGIADAFHFSVTSAELGIKKPDPRIFKVALERAHASPAQAIFVDDMAENVEAARALGMNSVHFTDSNGTYRQLVRLTGIE